MLKKEEVWCSPNDYIIILQIERPVSTPNALFCFVRVLQPYVNAVCFSSPRIAAMFIPKSHRLTPGLFVAISPRRAAQTAKVNFFSDASLRNRNTSESFLVKALVNQTPVQAGAQ